MQRGLGTLGSFGLHHSSGVEEAVFQACFFRVGLGLLVLPHSMLGKGTTRY